MVDIEKLQELPKRVGMLKSALLRDKWLWNYGHSDCHNIGDYSPYTILERVLEKFHGNNVNDAFKKYCTLVPKYQQKLFWETIHKAKRYPSRWSSWYIDEFDNIQNTYTRQYKGPYVVYSPDYKSEIVHKVTGHPKHHFREVYNHSKHTYDYHWYGYNNPWWKKSFYYSATREDFEIIVTEGWRINCTSKNDPRYQRYVQEMAQARKKSNKLHKIAIKEIQYSFLTTEEKKLKELSKLDIIKRDSHGFDENSFRGEEYHGRKNKKK